MRRIWGVVCLVLAVLLIAGAAVVKWVAAPALVKIPLSLNSVTVSTGTAQAYILANQAVSTVQVVATRTVTGDVKAGTSSVVVYDEVLCLRAATTKATPDRYGCVPQTDPGFLDRTTDRIAFDRKSAMPVADEARFKANVNGDAKIAHTGLDYTFPIDTKKQTYPFFDPTAGKSFPIVYQGAEKVDGLRTYRFQQQVPTSNIQLAGIFPGTYSNLVTVWVEPTTGIIVKGSEDATEKFAKSGSIAYQGKVIFTDQTVKEQVRFAKDELNKVRLVRSWLPGGALIIGLILLILGVVLARGSGTGKAQPISSHT